MNAIKCACFGVFHYENVQEAVEVGIPCNFSVFVLFESVHVVKYSCISLTRTKSTFNARFI